MVKKHSAFHLLQLLQHFINRSNQIKQVHSLLTINGFLLLRSEWINTLLYNTLIRAYLNLFQPQTSLLLFSHMLTDQALPNNHTFPSLIKAVSSLSLNSSLFLGKSLHCQALKRGLSSDLFVQTSLVSLYSQLGDVESACKSFEENPQQSVVLNNAMLDGFGKNGNMDSAISLFLSMPQRDVYSWTSAISGLAQNGLHREAVLLFRRMMMHGDVVSGLLKPTEATFVSVISSSANMDGGRWLYQGKQLHGYMIKTQSRLGVFMGTALIAFYGKMGSLRYAMKVFDSIVDKQVCTWNSIISCLAMNGREKLALDMYDKMQLAGLRPNEVTFVGVLSACARAKLVELGLKLFRAMSSEFGITPIMEHYGCIIDLLGRAGLLNEAFNILKQMPFEADASLLGALLGACRVHGAVQLGNEIGRRLLNLKPEHCGRYIQLSSIYADAERWDHAAATRIEMANAGVHKIPAFSMIYKS